MYDYAYDQISRVTPKQTPTKSASKQEGEIVLRQITRLEDIRPVSLPEELIEATQDLRNFVREGAIRELGKLLKGKNLGLARSAREALERIEREDDSRRVSQAATQALEAIRQAEAEQKAKEESVRILAEQELEEGIAKINLEDDRLATEKVEAEQKEVRESISRVEYSSSEEVAGDNAKDITTHKSVPTRKWWIAFVLSILFCGIPSPFTCFFGLTLATGESTYTSGGQTTFIPPSEGYWLIALSFGLMGVPTAVALYRLRKKEISRGNASNKGSSE